MISGDIAVITSSGRAYYKLVVELKQRKRGFLSLTPADPIPVSVRAVVTTERDKDEVDHPQVFVYDADADPAPIVDRVIQSLTGRDRYGKLVFGVDPGKRWGVAVMGDGAEVKTKVLPSINDAVKTIVTAVNRIDAAEKIVKVGNGASAYQSVFIEQLDEKLPLNVVIESVEEKGTTRHLGMRPSHKRRAKDVYSAIQISMRTGRKISRRRKNA